MYKFSSEFLPVNERVDYIISHLDNESSGEAMIAIKKITQMDTDMLLFRYEGSEGEKSKTKWEVKVKKEDLAPFSFELNIEDGDKASNHHGTVSGKDVTINIRATNSEPREIVFSKGSHFYASMIMPYLLRNIDYVSGDWFTFNMLDVEQGKFNTPIVQVKDKEIVEVPAGVYECWKLSIKLGGEQHWAWYAVKEPHYLVRYRYPDRELIMKRHY